MTAFLIVVYAICGCYLILNFKHDIHMLQQNSYRIPRYWRYLSKNDIGSAWRLADVALLFIALSRLLDFRLLFFLSALYALYKIVAISKKKFKKPLVFTNRVWRIYSVAACLALGLYLWPVLKFGFSGDSFLYYPDPVIVISILFLFTVFSWAFVILAVLLLMPVERAINRKYWREADDILKSMPDLTVIGITGSYGKTSTKHFLERILSEKYDVLMTPGSYNTTMGVIRTVRELLKPYTQIFICEMGAKQKGDIKEICDLVHPHIGIITAVGPMHLETFKSIQNVQSTKFELIDSLPPDSFAVINDDFEFCRNRPVDNVLSLRYSVEKENSEHRSIKVGSFSARNVCYTPSGTTFDIFDNNVLVISLSTRLLGECNVSNLMAAVIVALKLGLTEDQIKRGVAAIEPVLHRLSVSRTPGGITILDDAFNSNPTGSKMALDVLAGFSGGRRIVVTPGMIELGSRQYELNAQFGASIATSCDVAIIVGFYNREAISEGLQSAGFKGQLFEVDSFDKAQEVLHTLLSPGDAVLYENDLPDSFK